MSPIAEAERHDPPGLVDELVPGMAAVIEDGAIGGEDPVGEPVVAQELPEVLDQVQLRAFGRQWQEGEVGWHDELVRQVPSRPISRPIEQQHGVRSRRYRLGDLGQMQVHRCGVAAWQNEGGTFALSRTDRAEYIGRGGALIARRRWPGAALGPAPGDLVLLSDARFVLEPQLYWLACGLVLRDLRQTRGKVFLNASRAAGS